MSTLHLPKIPTDISDDWLCAALSAGNHAEMANLSAAKVAKVTDNVGFVSSLLRAELTHSGKSGPSSVIIKTGAENDRSRAGAQMLNMYRREVSFYRHLADDCPANPPSCYYTDIDETGENFVLVIEEIPGFDPKKWQHGASVDEAKLVVRTLGQMHAKYWLDPRIVDYSWVPRLKDSIGGIKDVLEYAIPNFQKEFGDYMPASLRPGFEQLRAVFPMLAQAGVDSPYQCLSHVDTHLGNLIFQDDRVRFIDWQAYMVHSFIYDFAYFINGNLTSEVRRTHIEELLDLYLDELDQGGVALIDRTLLATYYRLQTMGQLVVIPMILGGFLQDDEKGREAAQFWAPRFFDAMEDLNVIEFFGDLMQGKVAL